MTSKPAHSETVTPRQKMRTVTIARRDTSKLLVRRAGQFRAWAKDIAGSASALLYPGGPAKSSLRSHVAGALVLAAESGPLERR